MRAQVFLEYFSYLGKNYGTVAFVNIARVIRLGLHASDVGMITQDTFKSTGLAV